MEDKYFNIIKKNNIYNKIEELKEITKKTKFKLDEVITEYSNYINKNIDTSKFNDTHLLLNNDIANYIFLYKEFEKLNKRTDNV